MARLECWYLNMVLIVLNLTYHGYGLFMVSFVAITPSPPPPQPGDELVRVNGLTLSQATHEEVVNLIKLKKTLLLTCKSKSKSSSLLNNREIHNNNCVSTGVGMIPDQRYITVTVVYTHSYYTCMYG